MGDRKTSTDLKEVVPSALTLLEIAGHDLRNRVSGILSAGQYLLQDTAGRIESDHIVLLQSIESSGRSLLNLIDDLLELSVISSGRCRLALQATNILALIKQIVSENASLAIAKNVRLNVQPSSGEFTCLVDPARVTHILQKLVTSAIDEAPPNTSVGIHAGESPEATTISVTTERPHLSVDELHGLFEPHHKSQSSRARNVVVTALNLALAQRTIEIHGGTVRMESDGSEQIITLVVPRAAAVAKASAEAGTPKRGRKTPHANG
ncbi:MAG TPA: HAMP domain-containing sensor histidine kinase [Bryobacteraceae bacterium]|nr:HAMP domain-containing sensor histidine kinase [Bryobacteraceae bacterium]